MKENKLKLISLILVSLCITANATSRSPIDLSKVPQLSKDQENACGAILCLAAGKTPPECSSYIREYFKRKAKDRGKFLSLCPLKNDNNTAMDKEISDLMANLNINTNDPELDRYVNEILPNLDGTCSKEELNFTEKKLTTKQVCTLKYNESGVAMQICKEIPTYIYRTNQELTKSCKLLLSTPYSNKKVTNTCQNKNFFAEEDWFNGYYKQYVTQKEYEKLSEDKRGTQIQKVQVSYAEYSKLPNNQRSIEYGYDENIYYKHETLYYEKMMIQKDCWEVEDKE